MDKMINFGIDLGTTNSIIAKFDKGEVTIFKDPISWKETLPSVVSFRKDKINIGQKAKEYLEKSPKNVLSLFKRKMGTNESFKIQSINNSVTPIELSAYVLKELKNFIQTGEKIESVVITIPASFDTVQSNATKEAGYKAGFQQVVLLQEPIAASLAYANKTNIGKLKDGQWIVYDLGGGTFDVALIKINDGEMKIMDHEGDNFLGGSDFDNIIVEKLIIPILEKDFGFENLEKEMKSNSGKFNSLYYIARNKAEQAKIQLSAKSSAEIEFDLTDDDGVLHEVNIAITRSEFDNVIKKYIDLTVEMIKKIMARNKFTNNDIDFILMVGGSTYIPYVRNRVSETLQIPINCEIDPTNAVGIGAAFYAGTKQKKLLESKKPTQHQTNLSIKMAYQKATNETEEFFAAKIDGNTEGLFYRIFREDSGFDTGIKPLSSKITEDLPLVIESYNFFKLTLYDAHNNPLNIDLDPIEIAQGKYSVAGQPLPNDICLEVDDYEGKSTRLELIFKKNSILPLSHTISKEINKMIVKSSEDFLRINILEGPHYALPEANKSIGFLEINGKQISRDIAKGSNIEMKFEISESRDLSVSAYLTMTDQEFKNLFNENVRSVPVNILSEQIMNLSKRIEEEINIAKDLENYESVKELNKIKTNIDELTGESLVLEIDDITDSRYQIEDKKCKIAQEIYLATQDKEVEIAKSTYFEMKQKCDDTIIENGNDIERKHFNDIIKQEPIFLNSKSALKIREKTDKLDEITWIINWRTPAFLIGAFKWLIGERQRLNNQEQAKSLIEAGKFAIESENFDRLYEVVHNLMNSLPTTSLDEMKLKIGFY
ncbi:MAG: Hsp70 family protein [Calditrichaceae bacterium]